MKDVRLYIGGTRADLSEDVKIPMNYTLEDRTNPTVVKTSYSKTVSLPGTKTNNHIFNFFKLDRRQNYGDTLTGNDFDPSKRCPFVLYINGDLFESGYLKLDKVKNTDGKISYDCTLYGGLGDFFYNLSYGEDGEKKTLADLSYGIGNDPETEIEFKITKDTVNTAWNTLGSSTGGTVWDTINFAPAYNGIPDTIDPKKVLVNTCGTTAFKTSYTESGETYETKDGYCMVELKSEKDEWEMRDLRSHLQRPVIRMKSILNACFNPENNCGEASTGYTVDLDETFFNDKNPYWEDAWVTLPMLAADAESDVTSEDSEVSFSQAPTGPSCSMVYESPLDITGEDLNTSPSGVLDLTEYPFSFLNISSVVGWTTDSINTMQDLYVDYRNGWDTIWAWAKFRTESRGMAIQLVAYDYDTDKPIAGSDILILHGEYMPAERFVGDQEGQYNPIFPGTVTDAKGAFIYNANQGKHIFTSIDDNKFTQWQVMIEKCPKVDKLKLVLHCQNVWTAAGDKERGSDHGGWDKMKIRLCNRSANILATADTQVICTKAGRASLTEPSSVASNTKITKTKLLSTESSPADYLLSYAKTFGLYFFKDPYEDKIYIRTRNKFFYPYVEDINDLIDRSKEMVTTPNVFNHKWYSMTSEQEDTKYEERYMNDWGVQYGQQRINTNYNFDSETQELLKDLVYKGGITARERSNYLRQYYMPNDVSVPSFFAEGFEQTLYGTGTTEHKEEITNGVLDWSHVTDIYAIPASDNTPKVCFYDKERKPLDMKNVLLIFNGRKQLVDADGNTFNYWLTDDISEMMTMNDGTCWLYTAQSTDANGITIGISVSSLPQFTRVVADGNKIIKTLDFGDPKELYVDNYQLGAGSSIYSQYWKDYLKDQYDVNTKVLTCYVRWDRKIIDDAQRRFYWFDNTMWILNKIFDYDLAGEGSTKCEFIRVNDPNAYTYGQLTAVSRIDTPTETSGLRPAPAPSNVRPTSPEDEGYVPDDVDPGGYDPSDWGTCPEIEFADVLTESYCVENFDSNYNGVIDECEAASVTDLGNVFQNTAINTFDELVYFTGIDGIPDGGFSGCTHLQHIIIPANVNFIGENAFYGDTALEYIQLTATKPPILGEGAFDNTRDCPIIVPCAYATYYREQWPQYANRIYCTLPQLRVTPIEISAPWDGGSYDFEIISQGIHGITYSTYSGNLDYSITISGATGNTIINPRYNTESGSTIVRIYGYDENENEVQTFLTLKQTPVKPITGLTISVSDIIKQGQATATFSPEDAEYYNLVFSTSDNTVATSTTNGEITAQSNGQVQVCVTDTFTSISDCKTINVYKYATGITIDVADDVLGTTQVGYHVYPQGVDSNIVYSATGGTIDENGLLTVTSCNVTVCVTDTLSGLSACKTLTGSTQPQFTNVYLRLYNNNPHCIGSGVTIEDGNVVDENTPVVTDSAFIELELEPICSSRQSSYGEQLTYSIDGMNIDAGYVQVWSKKCTTDDGVRTITYTFPEGVAYKTSFTFKFKVAFSGALTNPSVSLSAGPYKLNEPFQMVYNYSPAGDRIPQPFGYKLMSAPGSGNIEFEHLTGDTCGYSGATTTVISNPGEWRIGYSFYSFAPQSSNDITFENGLVKHNKCGVTTIVGAYQDITVYNGEATGVTLVVDDVVTDSGQAQMVIVPSGSYYSGTTFTSSDASVATIDATTGEINGFAPGTVTICANVTTPNLSSCKTVEIRVNPSIEIDPHSKTISVAGEGETTFDIIAKQIK